jgi:hypothetical protein
VPETLAKEYVGTVPSPHCTVATALLLLLFILTITGPAVPVIGLKQSVTNKLPVLFAPLPVNIKVWPDTDYTVSAWYLSLERDHS